MQSGVAGPGVALLEREVAITPSAPIPVPHDPPAPEPVDEPPEPAKQASPLEVDAPTLPGTDVERVICAWVWSCAAALAVARCESGDDFYAEPWENPNHRGAFQISYVHAPKFAAHGWDWNTDGLVLERNVTIAFEIWSLQGFGPWSCA